MWGRAARYARPVSREPAFSPAGPGVSTALEEDDPAGMDDPGAADEGPGDPAAASPTWWPPPGSDSDGIDWGMTSHLGPDGRPKIVERAFVVPPELAGLRLDHFLKAQIPRLSRSKIQDVIRTQLRRDHSPLADRPLRANTSVLTGEHYTIARAARAEPPCPRTFEILYQDEDVIVIDKPAGLPVHASAKFYFNTLTSVLRERFPDEPVQICHRLDRETSGALVLARHRQAAVKVKESFAHKRVEKTYLAVVHGDPPWPEATSAEPAARLDAPLRVAGPNDPTLLTGVRMLAGPGGLPSLTLVQIVERRSPYTLVRCQPVSGRQHQIRAHLADAGFAIVGDKLYGLGDTAFMRLCDRGVDEELRRALVLPRHALHAASVRVPHPRTGAPLTTQAPLPADLRALLTPPSAAPAAALGAGPAAPDAVS